MLTLVALVAGLVCGVVCLVCRLSTLYVHTMRHVTSVVTSHTHSLAIPRGILWHASLSYVLLNLSQQTPTQGKPELYTRGVDW